METAGKEWPGVSVRGNSVFPGPGNQGGYRRLGCCVSIWKGCYSVIEAIVCLIVDIIHPPVCTLHLVLPACQESRASCWGTGRSTLSCICSFSPFRHLLPSSQEVAVEFVSKYRQGWPLAVCRHPFWPAECCALKEPTARGQLQPYTWNSWRHTNYKGR